MFEWIALASVLTVIAVFCGYVVVQFGFWKRRGVPQYGYWKNVREFFVDCTAQRPVSETVHRLYADFSETRYCGTYRLFRPVLVIRDRELIKEVTVKDFECFVDHYVESSETTWNKSLFLLKGDEWKDMRVVLTPSFTSSKLKMIFPLMSDCARKFVAYYEKRPSPLRLQMKDAFGRFANDVIAAAAFGFDCDSFRDRTNVFYQMGTRLCSFDGFMNKARLLCIMLFPRITNKLGLKIFDPSITKFFNDVIEKSLNVRKTTGLVRHDMIHFLMNSQQQLTQEDMTAQALVFFFAGFETVANTMGFMAYELALNLDIQKRLQNEIDDILTRCDGELKYELLSQMTYMDMVLSETLRKWPSDPFLDRVCVKPYIIQPKRPDEKPIRLEKGQQVLIPAYGLHTDEDIYSDSNRFDPERFTKKDGTRAYVYAPFGLGPRACVGKRFASMEIKLGFFYLLSKFDILVSDDTVIPIKLAKNSFFLLPEDGFPLQLKTRRKNF